MGSKKTTTKTKLNFEINKIHDNHQLDIDTREFVPTDKKQIIIKIIIIIIMATPHERIISIKRDAQSGIRVVALVLLLLVSINSMHVHATFDDVYDQCFIRTGCSKLFGLVPYYNNIIYDSWFCSDHPLNPVTRPIQPYLTPLDDCQIRIDCLLTPFSFPQYRTDIDMWTCNGEDPGELYDQCYIVQGCEAGESLTGVFYDETNRAWFCDDQQQIIAAQTPLDNCFIHRGCTNGLFPIYNINLA